MTMATYDPHLQRAFDGESRERSSGPPRAVPGAREASSGTTGRGVAGDAADGRTAAQEDVVEQAARAILAGLKAKDRRDCEEMVRSGITPNRVRPDWRVESWTAARALADAGLLRDGDLEADNARQAALLRAIKDCRDDPGRAILQADRLAGEAIIRAERAERERDDLLAMKARVEALADEWADERRTARMSGDAMMVMLVQAMGGDLRAAIRGEAGSARDDTEVERLKEEARWHWDRAERAEAENAQLTEALDRVQKTPDRLVRLSHWINQGNEGRDPEAILWGRVSKVSEECGEAIEALIGWTGQNPRKGVTHGRGDLVEELLDVAVTALGAIEHVCDHQGDSLDLLDEKVRRVVERAGLDGADS